MRIGAEGCASIECGIVVLPRTIDGNGADALIKCQLATRPGSGPFSCVLNVAAICTSRLSRGRSPCADLPGSRVGALEAGSLTAAAV